MSTVICLFLAGVPLLPCPASDGKKDVARKTEVSIRKEQFLINGTPTYKGRIWNGKKIEGLLLNARMVQAIFDDRNPKTVGRWAYPDTKKWDAERNTREFIEAMPTWRRHGLLAVTINLQGGSPEGYSRNQPWHNSAFEADGRLRPDYLGRLRKVLDKADDLGMVVILGLYYFGQDHRLKEEAAVIAGVDNTIQWVLQNGYRNVLIEINNECDVKAYHHAILKPARVHELIERVKKTTHNGRRLLAGTSYGGGKVPGANVVRASDFLLIHGNGQDMPAKIVTLIRKTRAVPGYRPMPVLINEDDHYDFDKMQNNFTAAVGEYVSWGFFDYRRKGEDLREGYQSPPVLWRQMSKRKQAFFALVKEITGE
jgi:hypothetical protein